MRKLLPYQRPVLEYAQRVQHPALFLEMRLGKTLITLRALRLQGAKHVLIVAPLSSLPTWQDEMHAEGLPAPVLIRPGSSLREYPSAFYLTNYQMLLKFPALENIEWDAVVLDESTLIKNPDCKIGEFCGNGFERAGRRFILSGMPHPEGLENLFNQFKFLRGDMMGYTNFYAWRKRYFTPCEYDWICLPSARKDIKAWAHTEAYFLTRKRAGVGNKKIFRRRHIDMNRAQTNAMCEVLQDFAYAGEETKWKPVVYAWAARIAGGFSPDRKLLSAEKANEVARIACSELCNESIVVYAKHIAELELLQERFERRNVRAEVLRGKVSLQKRGDLRRAFSRGHFRVLLCQSRVGKFSLDLSRSSTEIFYSNEASLEARMQCEDRIEHPLKKEPLLYLDFITRGSVDEELVDLLGEKKGNAKAFAASLKGGIHEKFKKIMCSRAFGRNRSRNNKHGGCVLESKGKDTLSSKDVVVVRRRKGLAKKSSSTSK